MTIRNLDFFLCWSCSDNNNYMLVFTSLVKSEDVAVTFERSRDSVCSLQVRSKIERVTEVNHHVQERQ